MARRSKADALGVLHQILDLYNNKKYSAEKIAEHLDEQGINISSRSIYRTLRTHKDTAEDYRHAMAEARVLLDTVKDTSGTELMETANQLMANKILENVRNIQEVDIEDPKELFNIMESLTRSQVNIGRLKMEFSKGVTAAKNALKAEFTNILMKQDPETLKKVLEAIDKLEVKYKRGTHHV
ncbi:phage protein Gp27 family protein [Shewanella halifaxensis]|uniref:phage protein Gp27 family protein n=1 Tax=Shewanella halifaxensis TaxID=271098 RepID=UPI0013A64413|nr:phage protein Gp27 family protein [Shewanella halifaxensis]